MCIYYCLLSVLYTSVHACMYSDDAIYWTLSRRLCNIVAYPLGTFEFQLITVYLLCPQKTTEMCCKSEG